MRLIKLRCIIFITYEKCHNNINTVVEYLPTYILVRFKRAVLFIIGKQYTKLNYDAYIFSTQKHRLGELVNCRIGIPCTHNLGLLAHTVGHNSTVALQQ
jgi:hypothetical protein